MVIDSKTLQPLHELTKEGKTAYEEMLALEADSILLKKKHPLISFLNKIRELSKIDSKLIEREYDKVMNEIKENRK